MVAAPCYHGSREVGSQASRCPARAHSLPISPPCLLLSVDPARVKVKVKLITSWDSGKRLHLNAIGASQVVLVVKNLSASAGEREIWVQSLDQEDPLEEDMATHSSVLAWRIPWIGQPGRLQSIASQRVRHH